jgi:hypothetical protein
MLRQCALRIASKFASEVRTAFTAADEAHRRPELALRSPAAVTTRMPFFTIQLYVVHLSGRKVYAQCWVNSSDRGSLPVGKRTKSEGLRITIFSCPLRADDEQEEIKSCLKPSNMLSEQ